MTILVRSINHGKNKNKETQVRSKKARMTIYQVKWFRGIVQSDNQKFDVLKIEERKIKINYDILGEQSKTNNNGVLVVSGDDNN